MKQILYTLFCSIIIVGTVSCGSRGKKNDNDGLTRGEKKAIETIASSYSDKVEIKDDNLIRSTKNVSVTTVTTYHFENGKCTSVKVKAETANKQQAQEFFELLKESRSDVFLNLKLDGKVVTYNHAPALLSIYSKLSIEELRDQIQKEIDIAKEAMKNL